MNYSRSVFLNELADLLDRHSVAITAKKIKGAKTDETFAVIGFRQLNGDFGQCTRRCHATGYELRVISKHSTVKEIDANRRDKILGSDSPELIEG